MASQVMRITLKAYEHQLVDAAAKKIIDTAKKNGSEVSGPVPLPTKKEVVTILRAVHKYKDSREQFEQRTQETDRHHCTYIRYRSSAAEAGDARRCIYQHQDENQIRFQSVRFQQKQIK